MLASIRMNAYRRVFFFRVQRLFGECPRKSSASEVRNASDALGQAIR